MRFTARVEPALTFDACDPVVGEAFGRISVWNADPELAERPRMLESDEWSLESWVQVEIVALDSQGELYRAVTNRVGQPGDMFDSLLSITVISDEESR